MAKDPQAFEPYVSSKEKKPEFTIKAFILGLILCLFFGISNVYLGLKTGTTISASIPAAIISMTLLRFFFKKVSILENNIVQTIATVGEAMASGMIFSIPALIFLGEPPSLLRIMLLSVLGGLLGVLFMIPLRRYIIVEEHKTIPFPEGLACAEILKSGDNIKSSTTLLGMWGFLVAVAYKAAVSIFFIWEEVPTWILQKFGKTEFSIDATPALLGVGYIIGPKTASIMFAGSVFSWYVFIPLITTFGQSTTIIPPSTIALNVMTSHEIWANYIRYIGAGAVVIGALLGLGKIIPMLRKTIYIGFKELLAGFKNKKALERTNKDISLAWLILGSVFVILALWILPFSLNLFMILLIVFLSFIFVATTSITVGIVGSTSNPLSGMTIASLLIICILFVFLGWTERFYLIGAVTMACVITIANSMASTTSQDLKTGFLIGATPRTQQIAELITIILPAMTLGYAIYLFHDAYVLGSEKMPAVQASLMALIAKGVIAKQLPFTLIGIGAIISILLIILRVPVLSFALGVYLPFSLVLAIFIGSLFALYMQKKNKTSLNNDTGIIISSGFIGGDALIGVIAASLTIGGVIPAEKQAYLPSSLSLVFYLLLGAFLLYLAIKGQKKARFS
jgi:putative OPT family oligopeptide transporter